MRTSFTETSFDVIILGAGPAGMSCAMWCADLGLSALVVDPAAQLGGQLHRIYNPIDNYLGARFSSGEEMLKTFLEQVSERDFCLSLGVDVEAFNQAAKRIRLKDGREFSAKFIVIATGVSRRELGIPGEVEFVGKGILESGMKARDSVSGKKVAIIGGGDAAVENSLILANAGAEVSLIHRRSEFSCQPKFLAAARSDSRIRFLTGAVVQSVRGSDSVEAVDVLHKESDEIEALPADFVLIRIGVAPNTSFLLQSIGLDPGSYITVDASQETSVKGVFAIGDVASPLFPTINSAVGQGASTAKLIAGRIQGFSFA